MLLTTVEPRCEAQGVIRLGNHRVKYEASALDVAVEDISGQLDPLLQRVWGTKMFRVVMTIRSHAIKNKIKYSIL